MTSEARLEALRRSYGEVRFGSVRMGLLSPSSLLSVSVKFTVKTVLRFPSCAVFSNVSSPLLHLVLV